MSDFLSGFKSVSDFCSGSKSVSQWGIGFLSGFEAFLESVFYPVLIRFQVFTRL